MKLLIMQSSQPSRHFIPLWSKYSPQHPVLKHPQYIYNDTQVEEDKMGGTCGTNGREEERVEVIGRKARGKETTRKTET
jgi:hypothetical protein